MKNIVLLQRPLKGFIRQIDNKNRARFNQFFNSLGPFLLLSTNQILADSIAKDKTKAIVILFES
jgi:hypothetical protein